MPPGPRFRGHHLRGEIASTASHAPQPAVQRVGPAFRSGANWAPRRDSRSSSSPFFGGNPLWPDARKCGPLRHEPRRSSRKFDNDALGKASAALAERSRPISRSAARRAASSRGEPQPEERMCQERGKVATSILLAAPASRAAQRANRARVGVRRRVLGIDAPAQQVRAHPPRDCDPGDERRRLAASQNVPHGDRKRRGFPRSSAASIKLTPCSAASSSLASTPR